MTSTATEATSVARPAGKRALICGVSGQDGAYLARHLIDRGYTVIGTSRFAHFGLNWKESVEHDRWLLRPSDVRYGAADARFADKKFGWRALNDVDAVTEICVLQARHLSLGKFAEMLPSGTRSKLFSVESWVLGVPRRMHS